MTTTTEKTVPSTTILRNIKGDSIFVNDKATTHRKLVESAFRDYCGDWVEIDFRNMELYNVEFRSHVEKLHYCRFDGADLCNADFGGVDMHGCILKDASCHSANFSGANLQEINFEKVDVNSAGFYNVRGMWIDTLEFSGIVYGIVDLGMPHEYRVWMLQDNKIGYRIIAGCRDFTPREAKGHWTTGNGARQERRHMFDLLEVARIVAVQRQFITEDGTPIPRNDRGLIAHYMD